MTADRYRLGIDFGTSSTVAVLDSPDGRVRSLLFDRSPLLASGVFVSAASDMLTGTDAERAAAGHPAGYEANPKRRIDDGTVWLGELELAVVDLVAAVLARVTTEARRVVGGQPGTVVLTYPAAWSHTRLRVLSDAAARAGLGQVGLVAEPVAAAAYFATILGRDILPGRCLVVYDLGAGTFDVAVVRRTSAGFEVSASAGLTDVGGLDLDATVVRHARTLTAGVADAWGRLDWPHTPADEQARHILWGNARAAKEQLSRHTAADLSIPLVGADLHLTRDEFDKVARPYLDRTVALTLTTIRDAGVPREDIAGVFLVGGSSRIPLAATLLHRALRLAPTIIEQPELVVAEGSLHTPRPFIPAGATPQPVTSQPADVSWAERADGATVVAVVSPAPLASPSNTSGESSRRAHPSATVTDLTARVRTRPEPDVANPGPAHRSGIMPRTRTAVVVAVLLVVAAVVVWYANSPNPSRGRTGSNVPSSTPPSSTRPSSTPPSGPPHTVAVLTGHTNRVECLAFNPKDGNILATGSADNTARLWNVVSGQTTATLTGHRDTVNSVAFSPDGKILATASFDSTVRLWDVATGRITATLKGHRDAVRRVVFSPDGKLLATGGNDNTARLWNVATGQSIATLTGHAEEITSVAFSPTDDNILATASYDNTVRVWDVASRQTKTTLTGHIHQVESVAFSPDGKTIATGAAEIVLWNVTTGRIVRAPTAVNDSFVFTVAFSPDGKTLATANDDGKARLWSLTS